MTSDLLDIDSTYAVADTYLCELTTAGHPLNNGTYAVEGNARVKQQMGTAYRQQFCVKRTPRSWSFESTWGFTLGYPVGSPTTQQLADYITGPAKDNWLALELPHGSVVRTVASNNSLLINALATFCGATGAKLCLTQDPSDSTGVNTAAVALALSQYVDVVEAQNEPEQRVGWNATTGYATILAATTALVGQVRSHAALAGVDIACSAFAPTSPTPTVSNYAAAGCSLCNVHDYTSLKPASPASTPTVAAGNANVATAVAFNLAQGPGLAYMISEWGYRVNGASSRPETVTSSQYGSLMLATGVYLATKHPKARRKIAYKLNYSAGSSDANDQFAPFDSSGNPVGSAMLMKALWGKGAG